MTKLFQVSNIRRLRWSTFITGTIPTLGIIIGLIIFSAGGSQGWSDPKSGTLTSSVHELEVNGSSPAKSGDATAGALPNASSSAASAASPIAATSVAFGMAAPNNLWAQRLAEVGGPAHIKYRRIYLTGFNASLGKVQETINAGMTPIISWKTGSYSWAQVASGAADADLRSLVVRLNAIPGPKFLAVHHEPQGDGTPADFAAMQLRALPILKTAKQAKVGVIVNGYWWTKSKAALSDAQIAQWIPNSVKALCDVVAADVYQDAGLKEDAGVKIKSMGEWARRTGGVKALGVGEFNGLTATAITNSMNALKADHMFVWAIMWNSNNGGTIGFPLTGDRLNAFKAGLATPNPT